MRRSVHIFLTFAALCLLAGIHGDGQTRSNASGVVVDFVALPPIDLGLVRSLSRSPDSPESRIRASLRPEGFTRDRVGSGGAHYIAGKVIVKFKGGSSTVSRASAMSLAKAKASRQPCEQKK